MRHLLPIALPALLLTGCPRVEPAGQGAGSGAPLGPDMVVVEASISHMGLQHPMTLDPALHEKAVSYVVLDGNEVTVYADTRISCPARVRLTGKWTSASGDKGGQRVVERQLAATRWECLP